MTRGVCGELFDRFRTLLITSIADGVPEIAQARRLGHHFEDRIVETYSHVAPEVDRRLLDRLEARWHAAQAFLHPHKSTLTAARPRPSARRGSVA